MTGDNGILQIREWFQDDVVHITDDHVAADQLIESKHSLARLGSSGSLHLEFQYITEWNEWLTRERWLQLGDIAQRGGEEGWIPPVGSPCHSGGENATAASGAYSWCSATMGSTLAARRAGT